MFAEVPIAWFTWIIYAGVVAVLVNFLTKALTQCTVKAIENGQLQRATANREWKCTFTGQFMTKNKHRNNAVCEEVGDNHDLKTKNWGHPFPQIKGGILT